ncbi:MAG: hypothetical protein OXU72_15070 [Gammaproteobacteria bacterium]|nr:hypothetical protein [Gammaproteobacteria bacterium]
METVLLGGIGEYGCEQGAVMSREGWATIGVGVALLTVLVTVAGLVLQGQRALRAELAVQLAEMRAENAAFRQDMRAENAAFRKEMRTGNAELRRELLVEIGAVAEQTAQLRDRVSRLEVLVGVVVERLLPGDAVSKLSGKKPEAQP